MTPKPSAAHTQEQIPPLLVIEPGLYRHYKGRDYEVIDAVRHSETLESMTLYRQQYGERTLWVRPSAMFLEQVEWEGRTVARFARLAAAIPNDRWV